jgi:Cu-Zn family superoxide dismutase
MNRSTVTASVATAALAGTAALALAAPALADVARASGEVTRYPGQSPAADAPAGASARVQSVATGDGKTIVTLHVTGFEGLKQYGAHAHTQPCGATGGAAGPHFQLRQDPVAPSVDPTYANPENEIWLDLATDPAGEGRAKALWIGSSPATGGRSRSSSTSAPRRPARAWPAPPASAWPA